MDIYTDTIRNLGPAAGPDEVESRHRRSGDADRSATSGRRSKMHTITLDKPAVLPDLAEGLKSSLGYESDIVLRRKGSMQRLTKSVSRTTDLRIDVSHGNRKLRLYGAPSALGKFGQALHVFQSDRVMEAERQELPRRLECLRGNGYEAEAIKPLDTATLNVIVAVGVVGWIALFAVAGGLMLPWLIPAFELGGILLFVAIAVIDPVCLIWMLSRVTS